MIAGGDSHARPVRLGLRENWLQFTFLVVVNVCVGGLVGLERTTVPLIGTQVFGLTSDLAVFAFIIAFGGHEGPDQPRGRRPDRTVHP